jgi:hypothetical protein
MPRLANFARLFPSPFMLRFLCSAVLCSSLSFLAKGQLPAFDAATHASPPDYSNAAHWSALPFREDVADVLPRNELWVSDSLKDVDVFYVHPTTYEKGDLWNASLDNERQNRLVDKWPVRLQASVFNADCRVYAPRYRQAIVQVFYQQDADGAKALDLAYGDVREAFKYFLEHYSKGRPFIIAGHSQGTYHTRKLLAEFIDTTALSKRMVAAYIIGLTVNKYMYNHLHMCESADETGCYISWMTYKEGSMPEWDYHLTTECVNPLSWKRDTVEVSRQSNIGTVVLNPRRVKKAATSARIHREQGKMELLWVRTRAPWFQLMKNLHVADYGLFYMDIRANVKQRIAAYRAKQAD